MYALQTWNLPKDILYLLFPTRDIHIPPTYTYMHCPPNFKFAEGYFVFVISNTRYTYSSYAYICAYVYVCAPRARARVCVCVCACVILLEPIYYWSHYHAMFLAVQHYITYPSMLGLTLFVNLTFKFWKYFALYRASCNSHSGTSANTRVFVLIPNTSSFCTLIFLRYFVVSSSLFFPYFIHPVECSFQKVNRVFLSLSQSWSTTNSILLSLRSSRKTSHPWLIHKRVASWKTPKHFFFFANCPVDKSYKCCFSCSIKRTRFSTCLES